MSDTYHTLDV